MPGGDGRGRLLANLTGDFTAAGADTLREWLAMLRSRAWTGAVTATQGVLAIGEGESTVHEEVRVEATVR